MTDITQYLEVINSYAYKVITFADSPYTAAYKDSILAVDTTAGAVNIILPSISNVTKKYYTIIDYIGNSDVNNITITSSGATINTSNSLVLSDPFQTVVLLSDGTNLWNIVSEAGTPVRIDTNKATLTIAPSATLAISKDEASIISVITAGGPNDTIILPNATTITAGWSIFVINDPTSTDRLIIQDNTTTTLHVVEQENADHSFVKITLCDDTLAAGAWLFQRFHQENVLIVSPGGGDFTSIKSAVDSITTSSSTNRFTIKVGPGDYTESPMIVPTYVTVCGTFRTSTVIASSTTDTVFTMTSNSTLQWLKIQDASGASGVGTLVQNVSGVRLTNCEYKNCEICISERGTTFATGGVFTQLIINICEFTAPFDYAIHVNSTPAIPDFVFVATNIRNTEINPDSTIITGLHVEGPTTNIIASDNRIIGPTVPAGKGVFITNDPMFVANGLLVYRFLTAVEADVTGAGGPTIHILSLDTAGNTTNDLLISHTAATGSIHGIMDQAKITIDDSATISLLFLNSSVAGVGVIDPFNLGPRASDIIDVSNLIQNSGDMGLVTGGQITPSSTALTINIAAGFGYSMKSTFPDHVLNKAVWTDTTLAITDDATNYIFFDDTSSSPQTQTSRPGITLDLLLAVVRTDSGNILWIDTTRYDSHHPGNKADRYIRDVFGPLFESGGLTTNSTLTLQVTSGTYYHSMIRFQPSGLDTATNIETAQTIQVGGTTSITLDATSSTINDFYIRYFIEITSGAASGDIRRIIDYDGATLIATVDTAFSATTGLATYDIIDGFTQLYDSEAGAGFTFTFVFGVQDVDAARYNDAALGTLVSLAGTEHAKHALYLVGDGNNERYFLQYGQTAFADFAAADAGTIPAKPSYFEESMVVIASVIVDGTGGAIAQIDDLRPRPTAAAAASGGVSDHGGLAGLLDDDHTQYLLIDGTRSMSGALNTGGNNIITGVGLVDGVDVSAHAARHGANSITDALSTAVPITLDTTAAVNLAGTADTFARSDHKHVLDVDHTEIDNIGTNSHATIDTHIADATIHFTAATIPYPQGYVHNAKIGYTSTTVVTVGVAAQETRVRDSTSVFNLTFIGVLSASSGSVGVAGGIQVAVATDTWYSIYIIGDTGLVNATDVFLVPDPTPISLPGTHDVHRRVGWARTDGSSLFIKFSTMGKGNHREYFYDVDRDDTEVKAAGSDTAFTAIDCSAYVPPTSELLILWVAFDSAASTNRISFRPTGSTVAAIDTIYSFRVGLNTSTGYRFHFKMPCNSSQSIDYSVSTVTSDLDQLSVVGFVDELE